MKRKEHEAELRKLHAELVAMQESVKVSGTKVCVVFEGRNSAEKGGTIKAITDRVSRGSFVSWRCPHPPSARSPRCTSSGTSPHVAPAGEN
jgi:polyphosphate kinase